MTHRMQLGPRSRPMTTVRWALLLAMSSCAVGCSSGADAGPASPAGAPSGTSSGGSSGSAGRSPDDPETDAGPAVDDAASPVAAEDVRADGVRTGGDEGIVVVSRDAAPEADLPPREPPAPKQLFTCDDLGPEPVIPAACATVAATKTVSGGLPSEETLDSPLIQAAIDACPAGQAVKLVAGEGKSGFVSGALFVKTGVTLWIDAGTTLFASRNPRDFDAKPGQCGLATSNSACNALINMRGVANTALVGSGTVDGRGGETVVGGTSTWWQLEAIDAGGLAAPRLVQVLASQNITLYQVTLRNAPKFHVVIDGTRGFRVWGITVNTPASAPNTDGVDPSASSDGIIAYNKITTGDDNVAIKAGGGAVDNLVIAHNHFGRGHGMSIGSETNGGVTNVKVCDLSLDGTSNGLHIKSDSSRGGVVSAVSFTDLCMRAVPHAFVFDPYYSTATGTLIPDFRDISVRNAHVLGATGSITLRGYDAARPLIAAFDNVVFDVAPTVTARDATITAGPGRISFVPAGTNVTVTQRAEVAATVRDCTAAWTTF